MHTKICYFPFDYSTDSPITRNSIEAEALIFLRVDSNFIIDRLDSLVSLCNPVKMDEKNIRLMLVLKGRTYFFDRRGNGVDDARRSVIIDREKFETMISDRKITLSLNR